MLKEVSKLFSQKIRAVLLILLGSLTWSWTMIKSGWVYPFGMGFWGANGHDGIWHIALSESLSKGNLNIPIFAGYDLQNYHIGFDLFLVVLNRITSMRDVILYFQIIPPLFAIAIGFLVYKFVGNWLHSKNAAWWSVLFVYFGGSFGWILGKGESTFWSQQAISTLINPPLAMSLIFILLGLIFIQKFDQTNKVKYLIFTIMCFGILVQVKVYAGLLVLGGLLVAAACEWVTFRRSQFTIIFVGTLVISLLVYLPFNKISSNLIVWQPFWFLETMMGLSDRIGWLKFYSAMMNYKSGHVWIKGITAYMVAFLIFILGNFGTRIIFVKEIFKKIDSIKIFMLSIILAGILIPIFFLQKGTPWNTIQFFYYSLFFSGILGGVAMQKANSYLLTAIIIFTIPTTIITLKDVYIPSRPPAMISSSELTALSFLSKQPDGVVLTRPFDELKSKAAENNPPRPLYLYASTAYVSAFSKHQSFLEDEINLDITGYDWQSRRSEVLAWYKEKNYTYSREFLVKNNIKYIYWIKDGSSPLDVGKLSFINIYENDLVTIYQVE